MNRKTQRDLFLQLEKKYDYEITVGWFSNKRGRRAASKEKGLKEYGGGEARKTTSKQRRVGYQGIIAQLIGRGSDVLNTPFKRNSPELKRAIEYFFVHGVDSVKRVKNLSIAILRKPMLDGKYKKEHKLTIESKGFSRPTIDTGQTAKAITAQVRYKRKAL